MSNDRLYCLNAFATAVAAVRIFVFVKEAYVYDLLI